MWLSAITLLTIDSKVKASSSSSDKVNEWCIFFPTYNFRFTLRLLVRSGRLSFELPSCP